MVGFSVPGAVAAVLVALLAGCTGPSPTPTPTPGVSRTAAPSPNSQGSLTESTTFKSIVDGDTIKTSAGTVRLIGVDTPERGECGHEQASAELGRVLGRGDRVTLELPVGENDRDRHGRLVRYVITEDGIDLGLLQLEAGHAVAKYDSTDGYPAHPREAAYHAAQVATAAADGTVVTASCLTGIAAPAEPTGKWWEQYTSCGKLKRNPQGHPTGPFSRDDPAEAEIYDWFAHRTGNNGDGDGDGLACEG